MAEHALQLRASYIKSENLKQLASQLKRFNKKFATKQFTGSRYYGGVLSRGGGAGFYLNFSREQRSIIKIAYSKNTKTRAWAAHGAYLQREHAQTQNQKGLGFNAQSNAIDIQETLRQWQEAGDANLFKLIISPENGHQLDLQQHAIALMQQAEQDLKTKLEWVAIDHHNTEQPHIHLLIRGIDDQKQKLIVDPVYLSEGFRQRSQMLATNQLGLRTNRDFSFARNEKLINHESPVLIVPYVKNPKPIRIFLTTTHLLLLPYSFVNDVYKKLRV